MSVPLSEVIVAVIPAVGVSGEESAWRGYNEDEGWGDAQDLRERRVRTENRNMERISTYSE